MRHGQATDRGLAAACAQVACSRSRNHICDTASLSAPLGSLLTTRFDRCLSFVCSLAAIQSVLAAELSLAPQPRPQPDSRDPDLASLVHTARAVATSSRLVRRQPDGISSRLRASSCSKLVARGWLCFRLLP